jgi:hypothetical protein
MNIKTILWSSRWLTRRAVNIVFLRNASKHLPDYIKYIYLFIYLFIYSLFNDVVRNSERRMIGRVVNNELGKCGRKRPWPDLMYYYGTYMGGLRETTTPQ